MDFHEAVLDEIALEGLDGEFLYFISLKISVYIQIEQFVQPVVVHAFIDHAACSCKLLYIVILNILYKSNYQTHRFCLLINPKFSSDFVFLNYTT